MRGIASWLLLIVMLAGAMSPMTVEARPASTATTTDVLNLRAGPSLSDGVRTVIPKGATVSLTGKEQNGFRAVTYKGTSGWAFGAYLAIAAPAPSPHERASTTDALNLRAGPGLSHGVLLVLPKGTKVTLTGQSSNGYRGIAYSGYSGWVSAAYIKGGTMPAVPAPVLAGTAVTTDALNLRAGAGVSHAVLTVMPARARVELTGQTSGGFHQVSYNGRIGWASSDYLLPDGAAGSSARHATTTDDLNLRSGPATSYGVLSVIPRGRNVVMTGQTSNGFSSVTYNGTTGWAFTTYLTPGAGADPAPQAVFAGTNAITGPARGNPDHAIAFARRAGAKRMDEVERYIREVYRVAPQVGLDPALLVSQSALETGYWKSEWWRNRLNPSGLGITGHDGQNRASQTFPSGTVAARAQIAHMHAEVYGSTRPLPTVLQGADASYQNVFDAGWAGTIRTLADLSGTWAADPQYHTKIARVAREMFG